MRSISSFVIRLTATVLLFSSTAFPLDKELTALFGDLIKGDTTRAVKVIAVMPFGASGKSVTEDAGRSVAEFGVVALQSSGRYRVVERAQMGKALEEIKLAQSGLMSDSAGIQVGKMLSADRLLVGTVSDLFGKRMISARIVRTETGEVLSSASVTVAAQDLTKFSKELLGEKGQVSATLFRSAVLPGWGQLYAQHTGHGVVSLVAFVGAAGYLAYCVTTTSSAHGKSDSYTAYLGSPQWQQDATDTLRQIYGSQVVVDDAALKKALVDYYTAKQDDLYRDYSRKYDYAMIAGIITGGVWALNLVDAAILGAQGKKKFDLYFSGVPGESLRMDVTFRF
jgi:hypothetical protein